MILTKGHKTTYCQCLRMFYSQNAARKKTVVADSGVLESIVNETYKPRYHPGRIDSSVVSLPAAFIKATLNALADFPIKGLVDQSHVLSRHIERRQPPLESDRLRLKLENYYQKALKGTKFQEVTDQEEEDKRNQSIKDIVNKICNETIYNWKPIKFDVNTSLVYLLGRSAAEFAVLTKIFGEIAKRDQHFKPRSLFDFGSGVGTVTWAVNQLWKKSMFEYFNVDTSSEINDLCQILLQGGRGNAPPVKGTFFRQFLPATPLKYDLVTCAFTLMELPNMQTRLETLMKLYQKTQQYLVIVEVGSNAGFQLIDEARDFILQLEGDNHVFSPCPHDLQCPRVQSNDGTPCNFETRYWTIPIEQKTQILRQRYSYIVIKKGKRNDSNWPRVIRPTLVRSKHTICRLCTSKGCLDEIIVSNKRHGKNTHHMIRSSNWGDLLPISLEDVEDNTGGEPEEETL